MFAYCLSKSCRSTFSPGNLVFLVGGRKTNEPTTYNSLFLFKRYIINALSCFSPLDKQHVKMQGFNQFV